MPALSRRSRSRPARRHQELSFAAVEIVGGLLTPGMLGKIANPKTDAETRRSYGVPDGLDLRDEIARAYRIAGALWSRFDASRHADRFVSRKLVPEILKAVFGFDTIQPVPAVQRGERVFPIGHAALGGRVPVVIAPVPGEDVRRTGLDVSLETFADHTRRRSATLLLQEYLNAEEDCLWGLTTDGLTLRLLRDNVSLTRPAYIEIDLAKIFSEDLYADFSVLWLLIHQSRFGAAEAAPSDCWLEHWRETGKEYGVAARDQLRTGVEAALLELGQGALEHPANSGLRDALSQGRLTPQGLYEELLGTVYRLIFLFAAEDRNLVHPPEAPRQARDAYAAGYGVGRLRERCMRRAAWDRHHDGWDGLRAVFRALARGAPQLGLPALGGLFLPHRTPHLDACRIANRRLMAAIFRLASIRPRGQSLARVNWRDMETEELGSVYEGLLELVPEASADARSFAFRDMSGPGGTERKSTGSYYTPDALVKLVLDTTLDPLLDRAELRGEDPAAEIMKLSILDPACGSGHFLLGAARRAAARIAALRSPGAPSRADYQHALREVVSHTIFGIDRNPLAVELCKVALWIEALEPGKPLGFLDDRIVCGDALIGVFDLAALADGVPDAAYDPLTGDDQGRARQLKRWNVELREGKAAGLLAHLRPPTELVEEARRVEAMPEDTLDQVEAKRRAFDRLNSGEAWRRRKAACDLYVAAFFAPKPAWPTVEDAQRDLHRPSVPLTEHVWKAARGETLYGPLVAGADAICDALRPLHWPLAFPVQMARGGFDAVIGNPPWERIKLQEQEFFAGRAPEIATARNAAARQRIIAALAQAPEDSAERRLFDAFTVAKRSAEAASTFARTGIRYPRTGTGDVNTYALFAELFATAIQGNGRAGVIVPTGIATDSSTSAFFGWLIDQRRLAKLIDFENRRRIFAAIDSRIKFSILAMGPADEAEFAFYLLDPTDLENNERRFTLTPEQIARMNPNTKTAPIFRSRADAKITAGIYDRVPVLIRENGADGEAENGWGLSFQAMFHMSNDSGLFAGAAELADRRFNRDGTDWVAEAGEARYVPLYEAKMIHHFDHRWASYGGGNSGDEEGARDVTLGEKRNPDFEPEPRYWVPESEVRLRAARVSTALKGAVRKREPDKALKALAEHVAAAVAGLEGRDPTEGDLTRILGRNQAWREALKTPPDRWLAHPAVRDSLADLQAKLPLTAEDLSALEDAERDPLVQADLLIDRKQPRWLMGWRDICRATDERTVIASILPTVGIGNKIPLFNPSLSQSPQSLCGFIACLSSFSLDFVARQKIGGTTLNFFYIRQFPVLPPERFFVTDIDFILPRVLELTYTSHAMRPWAEDLGHVGAPFAWDPERRAQLRAELDGFFARKYGLSRDELRYVLDPADTHGPEHPSETFRILKEKETAQYGEYRTRRLVLEAYDRLSGVS